MSSKFTSYKPNKKLWISVGIALFLVFTISNIPAWWGGYLLTRGTGLALSGVTGSVWNGRASLASIKVDNIDYSLGQLSWTLSPLSLLTLSPCAMLVTKLDMQQFDGEVCSSGKNLTLNNANLTVPAPLVQAHIPLPVAGQFSAHFDHLQLNGNVLGKLKGNLNWTSAQVNNGSSWVDIGSYAAEFVDDGKNGINAKLFELAGPVDLDITLALAAPSGGSIRGTLVTTKTFIDGTNSSGLLAMFAQPESVDAEGKAHFSIDVAL